MSEVQLPIAVNKVEKKTFHISEQLQSHWKFHCPYCNQEVIPKKGAIRRHHFAHKSKFDCNPSPETMLHDGAKHFIYNKLKKEQTFTLLFDVNKIDDSEILSIFSQFRIREMSIESETIFPTYHTRHAMEEKLGNIRPDVLSSHFDHNSDEHYFVWEVFVTHEIEEKKAKFLHEENIPFVEVKPIEIDRNNYKFFVTDFGNIDIFKSSNFKIPKFFENITIEKIINGVENSPLYGPNLKEFLFKDDRFGIADKFASYFSTFIDDRMDQRIRTNEKHRTIRLESVTTEYFDGRNYIQINGKYKLNSPVALLGRLIQMLNHNSVLSVLENIEGKAIGIALEYSIFSTPETITSQIKSVDEEVDLVSKGPFIPRGCRSKKGYSYLLLEPEATYGSLYVKSHNTLLFKMLDYFANNFDTDCIVKTNNWDEEVVTGLNIKGLVNSQGLYNSIDEQYGSDIKGIVIDILRSI